jgi:UDP-N-acetylglucosamine 4,6-dehydratase
MTQWLKGKRVLVTGGTGSFGQAFVAKLLEETKVKSVAVMSRDECKQWQMAQGPLFSPSDRLQYYLGDVRDLSRLEALFRQIDVVVHAAALKHVPIAEQNPREVIRTNIEGACNVIDAAHRCGVQKVVALSTDKAVSPINAYGATKLCADKLFLAEKGDRVQFAVVRYGNVVGSRGSVIPYFRKLAAEGCAQLPITDARMTRFWITLQQATSLVFSAIETMRGAELYVPKIPSMRIVDLAEAIAPGVQHRICGIRPGEKLHEEMVSREESRWGISAPFGYLFYRSQEQRDVALQRFSGEGEGMQTDFCYRSDENEKWLSIADLRAFLREEKYFLRQKFC